MSNEGNEQENTLKTNKEKFLRVYFIYDRDRQDEGGNDWYLGGGPCPVGLERFAEEHQQWLSGIHPNTYIEWEDGVYGYTESLNNVVRPKVSEIEIRQPGIRATWSSPELIGEIAKRRVKTAEYLELIKEEVPIAGPLGGLIGKVLGSGFVEQMIEELLDPDDDLGLQLPENDTGGVTDKGA